MKRIRSKPSKSSDASGTVVGTIFSKFSLTSPGESTLRDAVGHRIPASVHFNRNSRLHSVIWRQNAVKIANVGTSAFDTR